MTMRRENLCGWLTEGQQENLLMQAQIIKVDTCIYIYLASIIYVIDWLGFMFMANGH